MFDSEKIFVVILELHTFYIHLIPRNCQINVIH